MDEKATMSKYDVLDLISVHLGKLTIQTTIENVAHINAVYNLMSVLAESLRASDETVKKLVTNDVDQKQPKS